MNDYIYRRTVACPIIDVINEDTFAYVPGIETTFGGFNYRLSFKWLPLSKAENERRGGDLSLPMRFVYKQLYIL